MTDYRDGDLALRAMLSGAADDLGACHRLIRLMWEHGVPFRQAKGLWVAWDGVAAERVVLPDDLAAVLEAVIETLGEAS
jgi:hypothetical protein